MHILQERIKAVYLYLKYDRNSAAVGRELGYPSKKHKHWVNEYESIGILHEGYRAHDPKYSEQQKCVAVDYYLQHGRSLRGRLFGHWVIRKAAPSSTFKFRVENIAFLHTCHVKAFDDLTDKSPEGFKGFEINGFST